MKKADDLSVAFPGRQIGFYEGDLIMKTESVRIERKVTVTHRYGFHLSPASIFAEQAIKFNAEIMVYVAERPDEKRNGKRIIELIALGATADTDIIISAEGDDAGAAVYTLLDLVQRDFGLTFR